MEQLAILDMLKQTEIEDQWPTARISQVLKEEWDIIGWRREKKGSYSSGLVAEDIAMIIMDQDLYARELPS